MGLLFTRRSLGLKRIAFLQQVEIARMSRETNPLARERDPNTVNYALNFFKALQSY